MANSKRNRPLIAAAVLTVVTVGALSMQPSGSQTSANVLGNILASIQSAVMTLWFNVWGGTPEQQWSVDVPPEEMYPAPPVQQLPPSGDWPPSAPGASDGWPQDAPFDTGAVPEDWNDEMWDDVWETTPSPAPSFSPPPVIPTPLPGAGFPVSPPPPPPCQNTFVYTDPNGKTVTMCTDGYYNAAGCSAVREYMACSDACDNDRNSFVDALDTVACQMKNGRSIPVREFSPELCNDTLDNDEDGKRDMSDPDCWTGGN